MTALLTALYVGLTGTSLALVTKRYVRAWRLGRASREAKK